MSRSFLLINDVIAVMRLLHRHKDYVSEHEHDESHTEEILQTAQYGQSPSSVHTRSNTVFTRSPVQDPYDHQPNTSLKDGSEGPLKE